MRTPPYFPNSIVEPIKQATLDGLLEYSTSIPTGTTIGKVWKKRIARCPECPTWLAPPFAPALGEIPRGWRWHTLVSERTIWQHSCGGVWRDAVERTLHALAP